MRVASLLGRDLGPCGRSSGPLEQIDYPVGGFKVLSCLSQLLRGFVVDIGDGRSAPDSIAGDARRRRKK